MHSTCRIHWFIQHLLFTDTDQHYRRQEKSNLERSFIFLKGFTSQPLIKNIFCTVYSICKATRLNPPPHQKQSYHKSHEQSLFYTDQYRTVTVIWAEVLSKNADPLRWDSGIKHGHKRGTSAAQAMGGSLFPLGIHRGINKDTCLTTVAFCEWTYAA